MRNTSCLWYSGLQRRALSPAIDCLLELSFPSCWHFPFVFEAFVATQVKRKSLVSVGMFCASVSNTWQAEHACAGGGKRLLTSGRAVRLAFALTLPLLLLARTFFALFLASAGRLRNGHHLDTRRNAIEEVCILDPLDQGYEFLRALLSRHKALHNAANGCS